MLFQDKCGVLKKHIWAPSAAAVIDPHILQALTFFYELHSMEKEEKEGRHAACAASLPRSNFWSSLWSYVMRKTTGTHLSTASKYYFILLGF